MNDPYTLEQLSSEITNLRKTIYLLAQRNGELHIAMRNLLTAPNDSAARLEAEGLLMGGPWRHDNG